MIEKTLHISLWLYIALRHVEGGCLHHDPHFTFPPSVAQISSSKIRVSWNGIVEQLECVNNFIICYWPTIAMDYSNEEEHKFVTARKDTTYVDIEILPQVNYTLKIIAREKRLITHSIHKYIQVKDLWHYEDHESNEIQILTKGRIS